IWDLPLAGISLNVDSLGQETIKIAPGGDLTRILGTINVFNNANQATLNIDDSTDAAGVGRTVTLTTTNAVDTGQFSGLGTINYGPGELSSLDITSSRFGNTFNIQRMDAITTIRDVGGNAINMGNQGNTAQITGGLWVKSNCARPAGDVLT